MPSLQFTGDLVAPILKGLKTQTLRAKLNRGIEVGAPLTLQNGYRKGGNVVGRATISAVDLVATRSLTEQDARLDGFATLAELRERLRAMGAPRKLWRIRWTEFQPAATRRSA
jgi:hypothetical protein